MKIKKQVNFDVFDEDDWHFENVPNVEFFGEDLSDFYKEPFYKTFVKRTVFILWWVISLVSVLFFSIAIGLKVTHSTDSNETEANMLQTVEQQELKMERVNGITVSSSELISISSIFSEYTYILGSEQGYSELNVLCKDDSSFYTAEKSNREKSQYSLDEYDCTARAYRGIASKVSLKRVNDVIYKDGVYYCYVTLSTPSVDDMFEYYLRYSYEMTQFLNVKGVSMISISDYVNQTIRYVDYPIVSKEYLFKVEQVDAEFVLVDDELFVSICDNIFDTAVTQITEISGRNLPKENLG